MSVCCSFIYCPIICSSNLNPFINPTFSILLEFSTSVIWVMVIAAILLVIWSMKVLSIWHCVGYCYIFRLRLDDTNLVFSISLILNYFLYNIFLREHLPNIASEIGKIRSFQYTVFAQWKVFALNKVVEQTKMLPRDWQLTDGWDLQMFLSTLVQSIIMIRSEPRTLPVIFKDLPKQVKHLPKRIIKDDQKKINAVLFYHLYCYLNESRCNYCFHFQKIQMMSPCHQFIRFHFHLSMQSFCFG